MTFVVGLTGGIGSGKSLAAEMLAARGATVVDTDDISRRLTSPGGAALPAISEAFGPAVLAPDGSLDRAAMRARVFADAAARAKLEAILHPAIREVADRELAGASGPYAVLVVPLLFETGGYARRALRTLVIDCPEALQVERVCARSGLSEPEVRAIMGAQWPRWRRLQVADDVIWNGADRVVLERQCEMWHRAYCERAARSATILANSGRGR